MPDYRGYRDPYAGSIAELLARRGEIGVRSVENLASINARAVEQRGQAWGQAAQTIGDLARGLPLQIAQQQEQAAVMADRQAQTQERTARTSALSADQERASQGQKILSESIARHQTEDGTDFAAVAGDVAQVDPDAATKFLTLAEKTAANRKALRDQTVALKREHARIGAEIAFSAESPGEFLSTVGLYHADGLIDDATAENIAKAVQEAGDDGWEPLKQQIVDRSPEFKAAQLGMKKTAADIAKTEAETNKLTAPPEVKPPTSFDAAILAATDPAERQRLIRLKGQAEAAGRAPQIAPKPDYEWVTRDGTATQIVKGTAQPGDAPYSAPKSTSETAQDRQRKGRLDSARGFLTRLNELRETINTKIGPKAGVTGAIRQGVAAIGWDPDVAEYERVRAAGGRALAVAIMGAQNLSDADAAAWSNMLPDARIDAVTAKRLTDQISRMLEDTDDSGAAQQVPPSPSTPGAPRVGERRMIKGQLGEWDGRGWKAVVSR